LLLLPRIKEGGREGREGEREEGREGRRTCALLFCDCPTTAAWWIFQRFKDGGGREGGMEG